MFDLRIDFGDFDPAGRQSRALSPECEFDLVQNGRCSSSLRAQVGKRPEAGDNVGGVTRADGTVLRKPVPNHNVQTSSFRPP